MADTGNPVRTFFGAELRRKREEAGLTGKQLADALGCTPQWISTMESGRKVSEQSALDLDTFFNTDGLFHRLWALANEVELQTALPPGFPEYLEWERKANSIRVYSARLVGGLFQTPDYALSILTTIEGTRAPDFAAKRIERQSIFARDEPPHTWLVLDEDALRRMIGNTSIMREQHKALLAASERHNTMLQVIPSGVGYHAGLGGSFTILSFDTGPDIAYTESAGEGMLIEQHARVMDKVVRWDLLRGYALPVEESRALIRTVMESL